MWGHCCWLSPSRRGGEWPLGHGRAVCRVIGPHLITGISVYTYTLFYLLGVESLCLAEAALATEASAVWLEAVECCILNGQQLECRLLIGWRIPCLGWPPVHQALPEAAGAGAISPLCPASLSSGRRSPETRDACQGKIQYRSYPEVPSKRERSERLDLLVDKIKICSRKAVQLCIKKEINVNPLRLQMLQCSSVFTQKGNRERNAILEQDNFWSFRKMEKLLLFRVFPSLTCCYCVDGVSLMRPGDNCTRHSLLSWPRNINISWQFMLLGLVEN